jgi:hypothetical protein
LQALIKQHEDLKKLQEEQLEKQQQLQILQAKQDTFMQQHGSSFSHYNPAPTYTHHQPTSPVPPPITLPQRLPQHQPQPAPTNVAVPPIITSLPAAQNVPQSPYLPSRPTTPYSPSPLVATAYPSHSLSPSSPPSSAHTATTPMSYPTQSLSHSAPSTPTPPSDVSALAQQIQEEIAQQELIQQQSLNQLVSLQYQKSALQSLVDSFNSPPCSSPEAPVTDIDLSVVGDKRKGCNCKKSRCLKLYCECFAKQDYCGVWCRCEGCYNKNDPKYSNHRRRSLSASALSRKASEGIKKGCNCKKSNCLKKYCDCFYNGKSCTKDCNCANCKNGSDKYPDDEHAQHARAVLATEVTTPVSDKPLQTTDHINPYKRKFELPTSTLTRKFENSDFLPNKMQCLTSLGSAIAQDSEPTWLQCEDAQVMIQTLASSQKIA